MLHIYKYIFKKHYLIFKNEILSIAQLHCHITKKAHHVSSLQKSRSKTNKILIQNMILINQSFCTNAPLGVSDVQVQYTSLIQHG